MSHLSGGRARWVALGVVVGALAAAGFTYAAIPDSGGVINACYKKVGGQLRLVNSASDCSASETATQWNQTGQQGPSGPSGPSGPQGPGATWGTTTLPPDNTNHSLGATASGIDLAGVCAPGVTIVLETLGGDLLDVSGTQNEGVTTSPVDQVAGPSLGVLDSATVDFDGVARDTNGGNFVHMDLHGTVGNPCKFWWVIIPASPESP